MRRGMVLLAMLGSETVWLALLSLLLGGKRAGGAVGWVTLFLVGALLLGWNAWLSRQPESGREGLFSFLGALVLLSFLMRVQAPEATAGMLPGIGYWWEAFVGLSSLGSRAIPLTMIAGVGLLLWYRSRAIPQIPMGSLPLLAHARSNLLLSVLLLLLLAYGGLDAPMGLVFLLFAFSLVALALARADEVSHLPGSAPVMFDARWLTTLFGGVAGVSLLALLLLLLAAGLFTRLSPLFEGIYPLLAVLLAAFIQIIGFVLLPIMAQGWEGFNANRQEVPLEGIALTPTAQEPLPPPIPNSGMIEPNYSVLYLFLFLLLCFLLYRVMKQRGQRRQGGEGAANTGQYGSVEVTWRPGSWLQQQAAALRARFTPAPRREFGTDTVHDLYKNLLLFGDEHGLARPQEKTPYEYLLPLCQSYPQRRNDFFALTDAYVAAHYGERPFPPAEVRQLQEAWQRIAIEPPRAVAE